MKTLILSFLMCFSTLTIGQEICSDWDEIYPSDNPPGCWNCWDAFHDLSTGDYNPDSLNIEFPCGEIENSAWLTYYTGEFDILYPLIFVNSCSQGSGLELAVYDDSFNLVSNCKSIFPNTDLFEIYIPDLKKGSRYHVIIDGIDGAICNFSGGGSYSPLKELKASPELKRYCVGGEICFQLIDLGLSALTWELPPGDSLVSGGNEGDTEACIYLKSAGDKTVRLKSLERCYFDEITISHDFSVIEGPSIGVDTIFSDGSPVCIGSDVHYWVNWDSNFMFLDWVYPEGFQIYEGGGRNDTFFKARILEEEIGSVQAISAFDCEIPFTEEISVDPVIRYSKNVLICQGDCFQIGDSCYAEPGLHRDTLKVLNSECDSVVRIRLTTETAFPSPEIFCENRADGVFINWTKPPLADSFNVFVNGEFHSSTLGTEMLISDLDLWERARIKVHPVGNCTFLPAEISCLFSSSENITNDQSIVIVPNPSTGKILIDSDVSINRVLVFDINGKLVKEEFSNEINLSNQKGIFILKVETQTGVLIERVLIL